MTATKEAAVVSHVPFGAGRRHITERPGREPAVVVMHGFRDDSRIYDRAADNPPSGDTQERSQA
jgi:hypothetical protein